MPPLWCTFASRLHVEDLKDVQQALGIHYQLPNGGHYQDVCPACRRKSLAMAQDGKWREQGTRCFASCRREFMAKPPVEIPELVAQFGPTLNRIPATGWNAEVEPDRIVETHCCFAASSAAFNSR